VGQVAAVRQRQAHDRVARLQQRVVDGRVGLRAGVRLDVDVLGAEERLGAVDRQLLGDVDELAAAVVAAAGIALGVLVRQHAALRLEDRLRHEVLRRDHLERPLLAVELVLEHPRDLGIDVGEGPVEEVLGQLGHAVLRSRVMPRRCGFVGRRSPVVRSTQAPVATWPTG
jgi:hypothetical protein